MEENAVFEMKRCELQALIDTRAVWLETRYWQEHNALAKKFADEVDAAWSKESSPQCSAPDMSVQTSAYLEASDELLRIHRAEMRRLGEICDTLGLDTSHLPNRAPLYNAQLHRCAPQAV